MELPEFFWDPFDCLVRHPQEPGPSVEGKLSGISSSLIPSAWSPASESLGVTKKPNINDEKAKARRISNSKAAARSRQKKKGKLIHLLSPVSVTNVASRICCPTQGAHQCPSHADRRSNERKFTPVGPRRGQHHPGNISIRDVKQN
jgi:hypothetical protein